MYKYDQIGILRNLCGKAINNLRTERDAKAKEIRDVPRSFSNLFGLTKEEDINEAKYSFNYKIKQLKVIKETLTGILVNGIADVCNIPYTDVKLILKHSAPKEIKQNERQTIS